MVSPSVFESPVSEAAATARPDGVTADVSTVTVRVADGAETLPKVSVAFAVTASSPGVSEPVTHENEPAPEATQGEPETIPSTYNCTETLAPAVPVMVSVVLDVIRSLFDAPESDADDKARFVGAASDVSTVTDRALDAVEALPAGSD